MYNSYFGFSDAPFENNLDQRFLYFSANHRDVATGLVNFIKWNEGFALVCGDGGTGKTMLIHYLLSRLPDAVHPILTVDPDAGYNSILRSAARILNIDDTGKIDLDLADHVKSALTEAGREKECFVLIVDDVHLLSDKSIEEISFLSNIETPVHQLFQILFVGQSALRDRLGRPRLRRLLWKISINRVLAPMDAAETIHYIDYRLSLVGADFGACFEPYCRNPIFKLTQGVPRRINRLCDLALRICMAEKLLKVNRKILKQAAADLRNDARFTPRARTGSRASSWNTVRLLAVFTASVAVWTLLGIYGYQGGLGNGVQHFLHGLDPSTLRMQAAVQQPVSETAAPSPSGAPLNEETPQTPPIIEVAPQTPPKAEAEPEKDAMPHSGEINMQASGGQASENIAPESGSGAALQEVKQALQPPAPASRGGDTVTVKMLPMLILKDSPPKMQASLLRKPKSIEVKNGDTLIGIAARFFPNNKLDGVKKIIAANPGLNDVNQINAGQKLIIPELGSDIKDTN